MKRKFIALPKIATRVMPGANRKGFAAYKSDGDKPDDNEVIKMLKSMSEKQDTITAELKTTKEAKEKADGELKVLKEWKESAEKTIKEWTEKGATFGEVKKELDELKLKMTSLQVGPQQQPQNTLQAVICKMLTDNHDKIKIGTRETMVGEPIQKGMKISKAVGAITLSNVTGTTITGVPTFSPEVATRGYMETHFRDLVRVIDSATGAYIFPRLKTPTGEGSFGNTTAGNTKNQVDKDFEFIQLNAEYKNGYADVHKSAITDLPFLEGFLSTELIQDYLDRETFDFFSQLIAASTGGTGFGSASNAVEKLIKFVSNVMQQKHAPTNIVVRPSLWADILNTKPTNAAYSVPGGITISPNGGVLIAGIPLSVTATNALTDSSIVVGDFRKAAIIQVIGEGLKMEMFDKHDQAVYKNMVTFRVEARVAMSQFRTECFVSTTV